MQARDKIKTPQETALICEAARQNQLKVVFTNGCFDLLHIGHVRYLEAARELGDILVVGVNTDESVRNIKGPLRPIVPEAERGELVAALHCVDWVCFFASPDPLELITLLQPDILVKGADWSLDKIVGAEEVKRSGGQVMTVPLIPGTSTTKIIERIRELYISGSKEKPSQTNLVQLSGETKIGHKTD